VCNCASEANYLFLIITPINHALWPWWLEKSPVCTLSKLNYLPIYSMLSKLLLHFMLSGANFDAPRAQPWDIDIYFHACVCISCHFRSKLNFHFFQNDWNSFAIAFLTISDQNTTFIFFSFWMSEIHFRSQLSFFSNLIRNHSAVPKCCPPCKLQTKSTALWHYWIVSDNVAENAKSD
jgi:hypothetical protein